MSSKDLQTAINGLSQLINPICEKHGGGIVFICVMKGGFMFFSDLIKKMIAFHSDYHLKPVWDGTDNNLKEIEAYRVELGIPKNRTWIMPAGDNREQLIKMYPLVFNMCSKHGYNMTGRDHIIAFDTQRMV